MAEFHELIGPPVIYTNPYTGLPSSSANGGSQSNPYPHQESPRVSWGVKKSGQILWTESEWNIEGPLNLDPDPHILPMTVITLKGLGSNLSGKWWVSTVTHTIGESGYSVQGNVMRNAFQAEAEAPKPSGDRKPAVTPEQTPSQTYTVKPDDSLWTIAQRFYGAGGQFGRIAEANNIPSPYTIYTGQVLTIP